MPRKPNRRSDRFVDRERLLSAIGACREKITREQSRMEICGPLYHSSSTVVAAIDGLALMLTGRRDYFHLAGHGVHEDVRNAATGRDAMLAAGNLFANIPEHLTEVEFTALAELPGARIERIVSTGQASPAGYWYDQEQTEWVILLSGSAGLLFEGEDAPCILRPGDYVEIPARLRHRIEWTDATEPTVWLAVHVNAQLGASSTALIEES
ncbi:cupin domain-containing protein [Methylocystis echinoides]|uniref:cupin domain-containing protein n=1 Tax=Methylocystis echinoides TaxID=29468 RepID=UPI0034461F65